MDPNVPEIVAEFATVGIVSLAALCAIGVAIHAYIRRMRHKDTPHPAARYDDEDRLARIEQAVDAIAIEVERIAESQRFLTKLQTDRADDRLLKS
jgi:HD superfamily phosphodiesterase